jgi:integrase
VRAKTERLVFTEKRVERLETPSERQHIYDDETPGLGLKLEPTGSKVWFWFRTVAGKPTWQKIGDWPSTSVEAAREAASEKNGKLAELKRTRFREGNPFASTRGELTLDALVEAYCVRHVRAHANRPEKAERNVRWVVKKYLGAWRSRRLSEITRKEVIALHDELGVEHKHTANRVVELLRTVFNFAIDKELWQGANPAQRIAKFHEAKRKRFLSRDELAQLGHALASEPSQDLVDFVKISLWTGARKSDVLSARWSDVFVDENRWHVPNPKNAESYDVALTPEAVEIFSTRRNRATNGDQFVFPSHGASHHLTDLKKSWAALVKRAGIPNIRQHDLRRSHASWQAALGSSLLVISKSLGHQNTQATQIYSQLDLAPIRASVGLANRAINEALNSTPPKLLPNAKGRARVLPTLLHRR